MTSNATARVAFIRDVIETRNVRSRRATLILGCGHSRQYTGRGELPKRSHCPTCERFGLVDPPQTKAVFMSRADERAVTRREVVRALGDA